jgi:hypothetical protein
MKIKRTDVTVVVFRSSAPEVHVELFHRPTGLKVRGDGRAAKKVENQLMIQLDNKVTSYIRAMGHPPSVRIK